MRSVLLAAGLAFHALAVSAQTTPAQTTVPAAHGPLTETEFLAAVTAEHPAVRSSAEIGAAEEAVNAAARTLQNPEVQVERESPGETNQTTAALTWSPPLDGRRGAEIAAAEAALDAAERRRELAELDLRIELRRVFAGWTIAEERVRIIETEARKLDELARQSEERARRGEDSGLTARRFRFAAIELAADHARARAELTLVRAEASAYLPDAAARSPVLPDLPSADSADTADTPALAAVRADRARAEAEDRRSRRFLAFPTLSAGWQWQDAPGAEADGLVAGLAWELPLFDRGQADRLRTARAVTAARAREEMAVRRQEADLAARRDAFELLREAGLTSRAVDESAPAAVDAAAAAYRLGEASMTDFLDTIRSALAGRLAALGLHAAALEAHRELERAAGRPLPR